MPISEPPNIEKMKQKKDVKGLIKALKNKDVSEEAAEALGKLGDAQAVEPLIAVLKDGGYLLYKAAAKALGELGDARAVKPLINALKNKDKRDIVASALGELGDAQAVKPLIEILQDRDMRDNYRQVSTALAKLGEPAVEPLIAMVEYKVTDVKQGMAAMDALGEIGDPRAVEPLIAAFGPHYSWGTKTIAAAIVKLGEPAVKPLINALKNGDKPVREGAALTLGEIGDSRAVEPLVAALYDRPTSSNATRALVKLGEVAVAPLVACLQHDNKFVREDAAFALGEIGDTRALDPLIDALKDEDTFEQDVIVVALGKLGEPWALEPLIALLKSVHVEQRRQAAIALGKLGDPAAIEPLTALLQDKDMHVRREALEALETLGWKDPE